MDTCGGIPDGLGILMDGFNETNFLIELAVHDQQKLEFVPKYSADFHG